ncbi:alanine racemase [Streptococcus oriscaviae]|uniref:Alanine racemase n=1 Tax=Streptococcus oriscaviae TaxID=2781599 RepID=A0ABX7YPA5_9STRE|nr:alanine racemase [Streptococcus oriscaviae]QUE55262.1 alanine racemase [Streptococcus oriscaviae]
MKASRHRPTQISIDLEALSYNLQQVTKPLPIRTQVYAVVKANAYGHGVIPIAKQLADQVAGFCVSNLDEALELRQAGIEHPILVLGVVPIDGISLAKQASISLTVASLEWLEQAVAAALDLADVAFHIKVDTGMGRIGVRDSQTVNQLVDLLDQQEAKFEGIFTHFATADQADQTYFDQQLALFKDILVDLPEMPRLIHASNSATSVWHADTVFNMVRLGNVLYGLNPSGRELELPYPLKPVLSLTSELVHIKQLPKGANIGYGATYTSPSEEYIGTLPIGYADGLVRAMQGFSVLVDGQACPIVGRVSMDQITIRLPKAYPLGTPVTLIGQDQGMERTVQDWADYLGTINYEVVCLLSDRIPRYHE